MSDSVDHPKHYNFGKIEVITVIEDWRLDFHLGNAIKYIGRAAHSGHLIEDLKKARWYLTRAIDNAQSAKAASAKTHKHICVSCTNEWDCDDDEDCTIPLNAPECSKCECPF